MKPLFFLILSSMMWASYPIRADAITNWNDYILNTIISSPENKHALKLAQGQSLIKLYYSPFGSNKEQHEFRLKKTERGITLTPTESSYSIIKTRASALSELNFTPQEFIKYERLLETQFHNRNLLRFSVKKREFSPLASIDFYDGELEFHKGGLSWDITLPYNNHKYPVICTRISRNNSEQGSIFILVSEKWYVFTP